MVNLVERLLRVASRFSRNVRAASLYHLVVVVIGFIITVVGIAGQTLSLNFWLLPLYWSPNSGGPFTVLTVVASFTAIVFCFFFAMLALRGRNGIARLMLDPLGAGLCFILGFFNALNGVLIVYATSATPETYQGILFSAQVVITFLFMTALVPPSRRGFATAFLNQQTLVLVLAMASCITGIFIGLLPLITGGSGSASSSKHPGKWTALFALAMVPGALYNVIANYYLKRFTKTPEEDPLESVFSDGKVVKGNMLAQAAVWQVVWLFIMFPLDWTEGFGTTTSAAASKASLAQGWHDVFHITRNGGYFAAFLMSYVCQYVGSAILNQISSTLTSMVIQLGSPATALMLLVVPPLRAPGTATPQVGPTVGAILLLVRAAFAYALWEELVRDADEHALGESAAMIAEGGMPQDSYTINDSTPQKRRHAAGAPY